MLQIESLDQDQLRQEAEAIYGSQEEVEQANAQDIDFGYDQYNDAEYYTVTKITSGVRDPNRVNIFLDGSFAFSLDIAQVVELEVKVRQKITPERLKELRDASEFGKLYQRTLEWLLMRPHSIKETKDYLKRRKYKRMQVNRKREYEGKRSLPEIKDQTTELVLARLIEKKYLDDLKFAKFFVENRYVRKGISQKRLRMELKQKGINDDDINLAMQTIERPEEEEIRKVIKKKRQKYNDFQLVGYLTRQGFSFQKAKDAVEKYNPDEDCV